MSTTVQHPKRRRCGYNLCTHATRDFGPTSIADFIGDRLFLERMYRERAEHHCRDQRKGAVQRRGMEPGSGSPGQGARIKMKAGFRR